LDSFVSARARVDAFSGVVLVARGGAVAYQRAAGLANRETGAPMRPDTKLQTASVTKLYTQIAIQQLVQAGKVRLSDTVGTFLPEYPNAVVRARVTVEQLLRHRSGVGSFFNETYLARLASVRTVRDYLTLFQDDSLLFEPGSSEAYSNGGYVLLGAIIERASGRSYHDYLREHIFRPAGMTETVPYDREVARPNVAVGYTSQPLAGVPAGDRRLAGPAGARPGYEVAAGATGAPAEPGRAPADGRVLLGADGQRVSKDAKDTTGRGAERPRRRTLSPGDTPSSDASINGLPASPGGPQLLLVGPDGKPLSPEEARTAMDRMGRLRATPRRPNTALQPGVSGPAGDEYSTVGDFLKLARALAGRTLLDDANTRALLGARYAAGGEFRVGGGGPGVNAEFSMFANGDVVVVLSNYDPPAATAVSLRAKALLGATP
jgi:CubicO group peptidase (beta-lactamase class C family)